MSFWKYAFDNDRMQRADIERLDERARRQQQHARRRAKRTNSKIDEASERIDELEQQVGSLQLMNRALLSLLRESPQWDETRFRNLVYELDMQDGQLDGK